MYKATGFIHGNIVDSNQRIDIYSPLNNQVIGSIPALSQEQINEAFESADIAYETWKKVDYKTKQKYLLAFAEKIRQNSILLSRLLHEESGKSLKEADLEIKRSVEYITESIHAFDDLINNPEEYNFNNNVLMPKQLQATYLRVPYGVVLSISPFNYPVNLMITKIVPAILMGNCVVHKSSTQGSLCGWFLARLWNEISIDDKYQIYPGVLNYITGKGSTISEALTASDKIKGFSFTGSTDVGLKLASKLPLCPKQLELGGLNVAIILKDADIATACKEVVAACFGFSGQRCTAIKKLLVHQDVYSQVINQLGTEIQPYLHNFDPLIHISSVHECEQFYKDALSKQATLLTPEIDFNHLSGNYLPPSILLDTNKDMLVSKEEIFGPILGVMSFEDIETAIMHANNTEYGLQASIFSKDINVSSSLALELDFGRININKAPSRSPDILPFSGLKKSGMEVQGIVDSLYFFSAYKGVIEKLELSEEDKDIINNKLADLDKENEMNEEAIQKMETTITL